MNYQGKTLDDLATIVDEKLCPFSNELQIEFIRVSLKLQQQLNYFQKQEDNKRNEFKNIMKKTFWTMRNQDGETVKYP